MEILFTLAITGILAGAFVWLCVRSVPPNTLGIPIFFGERLGIVLTEGLNIVRPFCSVTHHSLKPRERVPFKIAVNVLDDTVYCAGTLGFQLLPPKEMKASNYLLLYDEKQEKIETDANARLLEMLDELLTAIPAECALSKKMNDAVQLAVAKGIKYRAPKNGNQTAEEKIIALATTYRDEFLEKMKKRGVDVSDITMPIPEKRDVLEQDARGLEQIFLEDYGVKLVVSTLALEPNSETAKVRSEFRQRDIEREIERMDTELVLSMIKRVKEDNPSFKDQEARDLVMVVQEYFQKPEAQRIDISLTGLENIPAETLLALGKMYTTGQVAKNSKGKGGKKQI
jgi:hypothetical protein